MAKESKEKSESFSSKYVSISFNYLLKKGNIMEMSVTKSILKSLRNQF